MAIVNNQIEKQNMQIYWSLQGPQAVLYFNLLEMWVE